MAMGMTYDEFWRDHAILVKYYREAYELKRKTEEWARWRQAAYIYDSLLRVAPVFRAFTKGHVEPGKFPEEPWPITEKEAKEREAERDRRNVEAFIKRLEADSERELKRRSEESAKGVSEDG